MFTNDLVYTSQSILLAESLFNFLDVAEYGLVLFLVVTIIGATLILSIVSFASFSEDHKNSAILSSLGASDDQIKEIYLQESLFNGIVSFVVSSFASYGLSKLINLIVSKFIDLKDVIICMSASTDSNWIGQYHLNGTYAPSCDFDLAMAAVEEARANNIPFHAGNILSADVFYDPDPDMWKKWAELGVLGVEMESFALYCNAAKLKKRALCILTVSDSFVLPGKLTSEQRATGLTQMVELAIKVAEKFAD